MAVLEETKEKVVKDQLFWDNRVVSNDINVTVKGSTAILSGTVPTYSDKMAAEENALSVPEITFVENNLVVTYPEGYPVLPDADIKEAIDNIFLWDNRIDAARISVSVDTGIVTLEGSVDAFWKKMIAENIVLGVSGVIDVINYLNVVWTDRFEDERIADDIKNSLRRSTLINSEDITVAVANGLVTLRGQVPTLLAKKMVNDKTANTSGVVDVENEIQVT